MCSVHLSLFFIIPSNLNHAGYLYDFLKFLNLFQSFQLVIIHSRVLLSIEGVYKVWLI